MEEKNPPCIGFTRACAEAETEALKGERPGDDRCAAGDDRRATTRPLAWEYAGTLVQFGLLW